ncbi:MAG: hypothetical protein Q9214_001908 [Letrouitia sp. 1 TL-2023]
MESEDWTEITERGLRKRVQNRLSQRKHRRRVREQASSQPEGSQSTNDQATNLSETGQSTDSLPSSQVDDGSNSFRSYPMSSTSTSVDGPVQSFEGGAQTHEMQQQQSSGIGFGNGLDELDIGNLSAEDFSNIGFGSETWNADISDNSAIPSLAIDASSAGNGPVDSWSGHRQSHAPQGHGPGVQNPLAGSLYQTDLMPQPSRVATNVYPPFNVPGQGLPGRQSSDIKPPQPPMQPVNHQRQSRSFHGPPPIFTGRPSSSGHSRPTQVIRRIVTQESDSHSEDGDRCHQCGHAKAQGSIRGGAGYPVTPASTPAASSSASPRTAGGGGKVSVPEILSEHGIDPARLAHGANPIARQSNEHLMSSRRGSTVISPNWERSEGRDQVRRYGTHHHGPEVYEGEDADYEIEYTKRPDGRVTKAVVVYVYECNCR